MSSSTELLILAAVIATPPDKLFAGHAIYLAEKLRLVIINKALDLDLQLTVLDERKRAFYQQLLMNLEEP